MKNRIEIIDYFKGFSIFAIVLYHLVAFFSNVPSIIKTASSFGGAGVHVFILCSGFGLTLLYNTKRENFFTFLKNRFKKLYVPYIIIVLLSFFATYMYLENDRLSALLSHVFLYKMFIEKYINSFGIQFWFISTLFQFYFFYYLIMLIKSKMNNIGFMILSCSISLIYATLICLFHLNTYRIFSSFFLQYIWEFSLGIVLASEYIKNKKNQVLSNKKIFLYTILCFGIYSFLSLKGGFLKQFNDPFSLASILGIGYLLSNIKVIKHIFISLSTFSYELYLSHYLVFKTIMQLLNRNMPNFISSLSSLIIALLVAYLYSLILKKVRKKRYEKN